MTILVHPDAELTAAGVAARLVARLIDVQSRRTPVHIAVTGGTLGAAIWPALAAQPAAGAVDWTGVHVWFSDERFAPRGHPDRCDLPVVRVAPGLGLPRPNIHGVPGPDEVADVHAAAIAYAHELAAWAPAGADPAVPDVAVSILGIGPDGHVASLFPGREEIDLAGPTTTGITGSPKPPPLRVTFTRAVLCACDELWMIAAGAEKGQAVRRALAGDDPHRTPAAGLAGRSGTWWFIDADLAGVLP